MTTNGDIAPRLLIVAPIRLYREGLAEVLNRTSEMNVVGVAETVETGLELVRTANPSVVLLDLTTWDAQVAVEEVTQSHPEVAVVALAVEDAAEALVSAAEAGVAGYVERDGSLQDLVAAIRCALRGEFRCSPRTARSMVERLRRLAREGPEMDSSIPLTPRELEIARLLTRGCSNKEIATELFIEVSTVKNHIHSILGKLGVRRRGEAALRLRPILTRQSPELGSARGARVNRRI